MKRKFKNSTIINKMNLTPKTTEHKKTMTHVAIQVLARDRHKNVAVLNQLLRFQLSTSDN